MNNKQTWIWFFLCILYVEGMQASNSIVGEGTPKVSETTSSVGEGTPKVSEQKPLGGILNKAMIEITGKDLSGQNRKSDKAPQAQNSTGASSAANKLLISKDITNKNNINKKSNVVNASLKSESIDLQSANIPLTDQSEQQSSSSVKSDTNSNVVNTDVKASSKSKSIDLQLVNIPLQSGKGISLTDQSAQQLSSPKDKIAQPEEQSFDNRLENLYKEFVSSKMSKENSNAILNEDNITEYVEVRKDGKTQNYNGRMIAPIDEYIKLLQKNYTNKNPQIQNIINEILPTYALTFIENESFVKTASFLDSVLALMVKVGPYSPEDLAAKKVSTSWQSLDAVNASLKNLYQGLEFLKQLNDHSLLSNNNVDVTALRTKYSHVPNDILMMYRNSFTQEYPGYQGSIIDEPVGLFKETEDADGKKVEKLDVGDSNTKKLYLLINAIQNINEYYQAKGVFPKNKEIPDFSNLTPEQKLLLVCNIDPTLPDNFSNTDVNTIKKEIENFLGVTKYNETKNDDDFAQLENNYLNFKKIAISDPIINQILKDDIYTIITTKYDEQAKIEAQKCFDIRQRVNPYTQAIIDLGSELNNKQVSNDIIKNINKLQKANLITIDSVTNILKKLPNSDFIQYKYKKIFEDILSLYTNDSMYRENINNVLGNLPNDTSLLNKIAKIDKQIKALNAAIELMNSPQFDNKSIKFTENINTINTFNDTIKQPRITAESIEKTTLEKDLEIYTLVKKELDSQYQGAPINQLYRKSSAVVSEIQQGNIVGAVVKGPEVAFTAAAAGSEVVQEMTDGVKTFLAGLGFNYDKLSPNAKTVINGLLVAAALSITGIGANEALTQEERNKKKKEVVQELFTQSAQIAIADKTGANIDTIATGDVSAIAENAATNALINVLLKSLNDNGTAPVIQQDYSGAIDRFQQKNNEIVNSVPTSQNPSNTYKSPYSSSSGYSSYRSPKTSSYSSSYPPSSYSSYS